MIFKNFRKISREWFRCACIARHTGFSFSWPHKVSSSIY